MKLYETLEKQLKKEPNFVTDNGELKKWVVINKAQNYDAELIGLLLDDKELKAKFFLEIKSVLVFNQSLFIQFLEQKNYLNDSYTSYKNKVGLNIDGKYLKQRNEVALVWPFKDCVLEGGQSREEDKREEIFFNETLAQDEITQLLEPKVLTNGKRYNVEGEKALDKFNRNEQGVITDNLIIKGNNLLALHSLKEEFAGKVKLIYIDPPYNTGNDSFQYNDSFSHSTWLTFMKNRIEVAKCLLRNDGIIMVHCDENEDAYLKILMDEIFERANYVSSIAIKSSTPSGVKTAHREKTIIKQKDTIIVYRKSHSATFNPQYIAREKWDSHFGIYLNRSSGETTSLISILREKGILSNSQTINDFNINNLKHKEFYLNEANNICQSKSHNNTEAKNESLRKKDKVIFYNKGNSNESAYLNGRQLTPLSNSINEVIQGNLITRAFSFLLCDFWSDIDFNNTQNEGQVSLPAGKKPELLLYRLLKLCSNEGDIVLDFHLGSGTTAAVAQKMGRQYIGIEQLDYGENDSVIRLNNVIKGDNTGISKALNWKGGGEFIYFELKKYNQTFIEQIESAKDSKVLLKIWEEMKVKSFLNYNVDLQKQEEHIEEFKALQLAEQKQHLVELLDKNQLYVNLSSLNDKDFACTETEKKVTKDFYQIKK